MKRQAEDEVSTRSVSLFSLVSSAAKSSGVVKMCKRHKLQLSRWGIMLRRIPGNQRSQVETLIASKVLAAHKPAQPSRVVILCTRSLCVNMVVCVYT